MKKDKLYSQLAKWYDETYVSDEKTEKEIKFVDEILKEHGTEKVLDVACGSGRSLIPLSKQGYKVDGIDLSEDLIEMLKKKIEEEEIDSKVWKGDMSDFETDEKYDAIIVLFTAFNYMITPELQIKAMKCFNRALREKGILMIDSPHTMSNLINGKFEEGHEEEREKGNLKLEMEDELKFNTKYPRVEHVSSYKAYENGTLEKEIDEKRELAVLTTNTFKLLSRLCGFEAIQFYGNFDGKPLENFKQGEKVDRLIYVGKKTRKVE